MSTFISKLAEVHPDAQLDTHVHVGPFCVVGPQVSIGRGTVLQNNVTLTGRVSLGSENQLFPNVVIGAQPQDLSYRGGDTEVRIGSRNVIREGVTINRATEKEQGVTSVGNQCFLMACCHIAHDCRLGDQIVMANGVLLGGHVHIDNHATLSGGLGVHHFASIGAHSFVAGLSRIIHDVPPYMLVEGSPARPRCVNIIGLKRNNFSSATIKALNDAHRLIYRDQVGVDEARELLRAKGQLVPTVNHLLSFIQLQHEGRHGRSREKRRAA